MKKKTAPEFKILTLALCCLLLSSCAENSQTVTEEKHEAPPEFTLLDEEKPDKENIYIILKSLESSYWKVIIDAAADASRELDCNVYCSGSNDETEWYLQSELIDIAVERGADAVILAPDDSVKLSSDVNELYMSEIPIILIDTVVNTEQYDLCYMTDNLMAGQKAAAEMINQLHSLGVSENEPAKVAVQVGSTFSQTISERLAGFCQYWAKNAPPAWEIIDEIKVNEGSIDNAVTIANDFFGEYEGIRGVFGSNNGSTVGFARYLIENKATDVAIVGFDYSEEMKALIDDDAFHSATLLQKQYDMGYEGIRSALDMIHGEYEADKKFIDTGVIAVNHGNLSDPDVKTAVERN